MTPNIATPAGTPTAAAAVSAATAATPSPSTLRHRMLGELVRAFGSDRSLLESKGAFILRRLCMLLGARLVYASLARILAGEPNREFAALVVELLNLILLTAVETADLREMLRGCAGVAAVGGGGSSFGTAFPPTAVTSTALTMGGGGGGGGGIDFEGETPAAVFSLLYRTWVVNPVATFSLCLLAQGYELCARIVSAFAERTITVGVLMQCDKLVQLLESPIFVTTRMHLTQPQRGDHGALLRALYGLLMVLPQGTAFCTLRDRLACVAPLATAPAHTTIAAASGGCGGLTSGPLFDTDGLFTVFEASQAAQWAAVTADVRARSIVQRRRQVAGAAPPSDHPANGGAAATAAAVVR